MRDIDEILRTLAGTYPQLSYEQLKAIHPGADDNGVWFFRHPDCPYEVQLEAADGQCPFLFETDERNAPATAATVADAISMVALGLGLTSPQPTDR